MSTASFLRSTSELPPPPSPCKRRQLRHSRITDGEMTVEQYLHAADPYRACSSPNPMPYPLRAPPSQDQTLLKYRSEILEIFNSHGFTADAGLGLYDLTKPGYPGGDQPVPTFRAHASTQTATLGDFNLAKDSLVDFLSRHSYNHVHVEVVHILLCFQASLFPIKPTDPTVAVYECIKPELLSLVDSHLHSNWKVLGLFRVGQTEDEAVPTVTIFVEPGLVHHWSALERVLTDQIRRHCSFQINVEFLPDTLGEPNPHAEPPGISQELVINAEGKLEMGFSIGLPGERGSGSSGGSLPSHRAE